MNKTLSQDQSKDDEQVIRADNASTPEAAPKKEYQPLKLDTLGTLPQLTQSPVSTP